MNIEINLRVSKKITNKTVLDDALQLRYYVLAAPAVRAPRRAYADALVFVRLLYLCYRRQSNACNVCNAPMVTHRKMDDTSDDTANISAFKVLKSLILADG